jgi:hypothetical protein
MLYTVIAYTLATAITTMLGLMATDTRRGLICWMLWSGCLFLFMKQINNPDSSMYYMNWIM